MAGIITPQFGFRNATVDHSPSPLSFGFGLSSAAAVPGWQPPGMQNASSFSPAPSTVGNSSKPAQKRRHEDADGDESMERSPTPERRNTRPMKRIASHRYPPRLDEGEKANRKDNEGSSSGSDVDVGMLLASLPPQSLLPILTSLLSAHPSLKPTVLSLIPRPALDTALAAVNRAAKKLVDEYPYSATTSNGGNALALNSSTLLSHLGPQTPFRSSPMRCVSGFGRLQQTEAQQSGMRDQYILSRIRPHIDDFVTTAFSYMPYFSLVSELSTDGVTNAQREKVYAHPSETFAYLSSLTNHLLGQSQLCQTALAPILLPRLLKEWMAWVERIDVLLKGGSMIGSNVAETWLAALDRAAESTIVGVEGETALGFKSIRDRWLAVAGWLVGRAIPFAG